jgi:hypothetical protein
MITWDIEGSGRRLSTAAQGYSDIIDFRVSLSASNGAYEVLGSTTNNYYLVTGLTPGIQYYIKIEQRNEYGYSEFSNPISFLSAYIPEIPDTVTTSIVDFTYIKIQWQLASENGSPITAYKVFMKVHGTTDYIEESVDCVGSDATVISTREC